MLFFTRTQADNYISNGYTFEHTSGNAELKAEPSTLVQVSDMYFLFRNNLFTLDHDCYYINKNGSYDTNAPLPFAGYLPENEARFLESRFKHLIGKTELVTKATITELRAMPVTDMASLVNVGGHQPYDWAVFAKIHVKVTEPFTDGSFERWIIFNNQAATNGGVPTIDLRYFEEERTPWQELYNDYKKEKYRHTAQSSYMMYHMLTIKEILTPEEGQLKIIYDEISPLEWGNGISQRTNERRYQLYVNYSKWGYDADYPDGFEMRMPLMEYLLNESNDGCIELKKLLGIRNSIIHDIFEADKASIKKVLTYR